ncbi:hypothetical protein, partial [Alteromonas sp. 14N.309.X.WAT.G.H12]|uniref:hypothetical protein n=1 Tax=Alteromonas sp. 14N.309.X.WAT.G.H12 TaxID=3120824 RepID=UPI002FD147A3
MASKFDFTEYIAEVERLTRGHRFVESEEETGVVVTVGNTPLHPGFIYGYNCHDHQDPKMWAKLLSRLGTLSETPPPLPVVMHFDPDAKPVPCVEHNFFVNAVDSLPIIMEAFMNTGKSFFVLTPVQALSIE